VVARSSGERPRRAVLSAISAPRRTKTQGAADANKQWNGEQPLAAGQAVGPPQERTADGDLDTPTVAGNGRRCRDRRSRAGSGSAAGDRDARRAIPRLIRAAMAGGIGLATVGGVAAFAGTAQATDLPGATGAVYTMTNSSGGNAIEAYARASDGSLTPDGTYPTGGNGGALGSGHSIVVSRDGSVVVNVNAGSKLDLGVRRHTAGPAPDRQRQLGRYRPEQCHHRRRQPGLRAQRRLRHDRRVPAQRRRLHAITGVGPAARRGSAGAAADPFNDEGNVLVVDEGRSNTIDTFVVGPNGQAGPAITTASVGGAPFGFDFDRAGHLLISDAALTPGSSGATSYNVAPGGTVTANGPAVPIDQAAACWLAAAGGFASTANAGSGSIGRYAVAPDGTLTALGSTLVENNPASRPLDESVRTGQNYLYVLANGLSQIVGYQVGADGSLTQVTTAPVAAGSGGIGAN
jgi:hypothetical protein